MLGELAEDGGIVVFDMEAGAGTLLRMAQDVADVVLVVAEPSAKSIEVARRMSEIGSDKARVVVLANKVRDDEDLEAIGSQLSGYELVVIPHDDAVQRAERRGLSPIEVDAESPAVVALGRLAEQLAPRMG